MEEIIIDGESLTFDQVPAVANGESGAPRVTLSSKAKENVGSCDQAVEDL